MNQTVAGIDWSAHFFDVCVYSTTDGVLYEGRFNIDGPGINRLLGVLKRHGPIEAIGIEDGRQLVANRMMQHGYDVRTVHPFSLARFKEVYETTRRKDDRMDAMYIARMLAEKPQAFRSITQNSPECTRLEALNRQKRRLVEDRSRLQNRLRAVLRGYFPAFSGCFQRNLSRSALQLLQRIERPSVIAGLSREAFLEYAEGCRFNGARKLAIYERLVEHTIVEEPGDIEERVLEMQHLVQMMILHDMQLQQLQESIDALYDSHPMAGVFDSIPGVAGDLRVRLLTAFGDNLNRFRDHRAVQAFAGTAPITIRSGKREVVTMRTGCNKAFRDTLYQLAFTTMGRLPWARAHYNRQKAAGKSHSAALRSLSNKWVPILFSMWRASEIYSEDRRAA